MAYDSITCTGFTSEGLDDDAIDYVLVKMMRSDIIEIQRFVKFAAEQSDQYGFVKDCVGMEQRLRQVLIDHRRFVDGDSDGL